MSSSKNTSEEIKSEELSFEHRALDWIISKRKTILILAIGIVVAAFSYKAFSVFAKIKTNKRLEQFAEAKTLEDRLAWSNANAKGTLRNLAGSNFLEAADLAYRKKQYDEALKFFEQAKASLTNTIFLKRAELGYAVTAYNLGRIEDSKKIFNSLAYDNKIQQSFSLEATYFLALIAYQEKDKNSLELYQGKIEKSKESNQKRFYLEKVKELNNSL